MAEIYFKILYFESQNLHKQRQTKVFTLHLMHIPMNLTSTCKSRTVTTYSLFSLAYRIRGCSDAQIELKRHATDDFATFTIMFGRADYHINFNNSNDGNTEYQYESINVHEPLLSCVDFKKFWFKWADGTFYLGRGEVNNQVLAYMADYYGPRTFETLHLRNMQTSPNVLEWEFQNDAGICYNISGRD